jgi:hypothetical protein
MNDKLFLSEQKIKEFLSNLIGFCSLVSYGLSSIYNFPLFIFFKNIEFIFAFIVKQTKMSYRVLLLLTRQPEGTRKKWLIKPLNNHRANEFHHIIRHFFLPEDRTLCPPLWRSITQFGLGGVLFHRFPPYASQETFYKYNRSCQLSFRNFRAKLIETSSKQLVSGRLMKLCRLDAAESNCRHVSRYPENEKVDERFVGL